MKIAIIGVGEVGSCFAEALYGQGHELLLCDNKITRRIETVASRMGLTPVEEVGDWVRDADAVIVSTTGIESKAVSMQCAELLRPDTWLADFTTAHPDDKRAASAHANRCSVKYADVAIMGGISLTYAKTPLLVAGDGAAQLSALLAPLSSAIRVIDRPAGDAVALKLLRSVFTKGMEALGVEMLLVAEQQGVREQLYEVLSDIDDGPIRNFLDMVVRTHVIHAARRSHEVAQAAEQMASLGHPSRVLPGVRDRFEATVHALGRRPIQQEVSTVDDALDWLRSV